MEETKMNKAKVIEALNMTIAGLTIIKDELEKDGNAVAPAPAKKEEKSNVIPMPLPVEEPETVKGHFTREDLDAMKFNDLKKLGASLGVKCTGTRDQISERILAVEVEVAVEDVEAVEEVEAPVEEAPKADKKKLGKKAKEEPAEEEVEDEYLDYAKELAEDMSVEEIKEALEEAGVKIKSKKKDVLVKELANALREGLIEVEDDEEEADEESEGEEVSADMYYEDFDPEGYNVPENMTKERFEACLKLATNALEQIKSGEMSMDDVFDYLEDNTTDEEKGLLDETPAHDEVVAFFLELLKRTVDNDGEVHDPSDPYEIGELNMCCGHELKYDKKSKNYICEICGEEYEAE